MQTLSVGNFMHGSVIPQRSSSVFLGADLLQSFRHSYPRAYSISSLGCLNTVSGFSQQMLNSSSPPISLHHKCGPQMFPPTHCQSHSLDIILASSSPLPMSTQHQLLSFSPPKYFLNKLIPHHCHTPHWSRRALSFI